MNLFESLESRQMMSASAAVNGGVLRIDGTDATDRILVEQVTRDVLVNAKGKKAPNGSQTVLTQVQRYHVRVADMLGHVVNDASGSPLDRDFPVTGITRIDVVARAGNDTVTTSATSVKNMIYLGSGNDNATTGSGDDQVYGDAGNDTATLGAGEDAFVGSGGNDTAYGGAGPDNLFGNSGNDKLYGEAGNDWLEAGSASETAEGGTGTNFNAHRWAIGGTDRADVKQGRAHTCSLMSTLAAASYQGHDLSSNITYEGDYNYRVRMYDTEKNMWMSIKVKFDGTLLRRASDNKVIDPVSVTEGAQNTKEFWTLLYQRAYLDYFQHRDVTDEDSVMSFTSDPHTAQTMKNVLGVDTSTEGMPWFAEDLKAKLDNGQVVTAGGTGHRYAVLEVFQDGSEWKVKLFNPRAYDGTHNDMPIEEVGADNGVFHMTWSNFTNSEYFKNYTFSRS